MQASESGGNGGPSRVVVNSDSLTIKGEEKAGALVALTSGRVDGSNAKEFQNALESLLDENVNSLVLDLEDLAYISSAGLRVILLVARRIHSSQGKFGVCSLPEPIQEVFQISGFDKIIQTYGAQADAISAITK